MDTQRDFMKLIYLFLYFHCYDISLLFILLTHTTYLCYRCSLLCVQCSEERYSQAVGGLAVYDL
jgi:hypothetical protein